MSSVGRSVYHRSAMPGLRRLCALSLALVLAASVLAACGSSSTTSSSASASGGTVVTTKSSSLGTILATGSGRTLYLATSSCTGSCLTAWPPLKANGTPKAEGSASASLLGTASVSGGEIVVTYNGHPLYTFASDTASDPTSGQGQAGFYVVSPSGGKVTSATSGTQSKKPAARAPGS